MISILASEVFETMVNERLLTLEEVDMRFLTDLSGVECQVDVYECPLCNIELESKDVVGFDSIQGFVCIGYICPECSTPSKRPATTLEYELFLKSIGSVHGARNRYFTHLY